MFDKKLWKPQFRYWPTWSCPSCRSVALGLPKAKDKLLDEETGPSKRAHDEDEWEVEWIERKFATILQCHNPACGDMVAVAGRVSVEQNYDYDENGETVITYDDWYMPIFFDQAPRFSPFRANVQQA